MERQNGVSQCQYNRAMKKQWKCQFESGKKSMTLNDKLAAMWTISLRMQSHQIDDAKSQMNSAKAQLESSKKALGR